MLVSAPGADVVPASAVSTTVGVRPGGSGIVAARAIGAFVAGATPDGTFCDSTELGGMSTGSVLGTQVPDLIVVVPSGTDAVK
jgi:hypothetical protein